MYCEADRVWDMRPKGEVEDDSKHSSLSNWTNCMVVPFSLMENTGGVASEV